MWKKPVPICTAKCAELCASTMMTRFRVDTVIVELHMETIIELVRVPYKCRTCCCKVNKQFCCSFCYIPWKWLTMGKAYSRYDVVKQSETPLIAGFMGPIWGPCGADRTQVWPMLALWTLLSGSVSWQLQRPILLTLSIPKHQRYK